MGGMMGRGMMQQGMMGIRNEYVRLSYVPVETMNEGAFEPPS